jgi:hypothetical protein
MTLDDEQLPEYGPSFKKLDVEVTPETVERLHVKILPSGIKRWEVPDSIVPRLVAVHGQQFLVCRSSLFWQQSGWQQLQGARVLDVAPCSSSRVRMILLLRPAALATPVSTNSTVFSSTRHTVDLAVNSQYVDRTSNA